MRRPGRRWSRRGDEGVALIGVIGAMAVISALLITALTVGANEGVAARRDQDARIATALAEAGIDEYLSRLTADETYWQKGDDDASNPAFGPAGRPLPGSTDTNARFRYTVLSTPSETARTNAIRLQVTGISSPGNGRAPLTRTLTTTLTPAGFIDYLYLTDYELVDPDLSGDPASCVAYYYESRSSSCSSLQWVAADTVRGPLHTNDAMQVNGAARFQGTTTSSWPALNGSAVAKTWWGTQAPPLPAGSPSYGDPVPLPVGNTQVKTYVSPDVDGDPSTPPGAGCYYTGATRIVFAGKKMKVLSPSTSRADTPARCLVVADRAKEQTLDVPPVIYVDATTASCTNGTIGYPVPGEKVTAGSASAASWTSTGDNRTTNYTCQRGLVTVEGAVDTQVSVVALDDIVVTGDLTLTDGGTDTDVVGLVAGNYVWVHHPLTSGGNDLRGASSSVHTIQAAILALRHSFVVQNWTEGSPRGALTVNGSIAQKFRGPVGTGSGSTISTGYAKDYRYDTRLSYLQPPYFLRPSASQWRAGPITDG